MQLGLAALVVAWGCVCVQAALRGSGHAALSMRLPSHAGSVAEGSPESISTRVLATGLAAVEEGWAWPVLGGLIGVGLGGVVGLALGTGIGVASTVMGRRKRRRETVALLDDQLADLVRALAANVRSGRSIHQAFAHAAAETDPPLRSSLSSAVDALELGIPLDRVLQGWAATIGSEDARLVAGVVNLHRRSGGDLPTILEQVASTLRDRRAAGREIEALTAQARMSGAVLALLPLGFFLFLWVTSRDDIQHAFASRTGAAAIALGLLLDVAAFGWIRRILEVRS